MANHVILPSRAGPRGIFSACTATLTTREIKLHYTDLLLGVHTSCPDVNDRDLSPEIAICLTPDKGVRVLPQPITVNQSQKIPKILLVPKAPDHRRLRQEVHGRLNSRARMETTRKFPI